VPACKQIGGLPDTNLPVQFRVQRHEDLAEAAAGMCAAAGSSNRGREIGRDFGILVLLPSARRSRPPKQFWVIMFDAEDTSPDAPNRVLDASACRDRAADQTGTEAPAFAPGCDDDGITLSASVPPAGQQNASPAQQAPVVPEAVANRLRADRNPTGQRCSWNARQGGRDRRMLLRFRPGTR
jgi:hypothetical protein